MLINKGFERYCLTVTSSNIFRIFSNTHRLVTVSVTALLLVFRQNSNEQSIASQWFERLVTVVTDFLHIPTHLTFFGGKTWQ
jgi:hypothetical protein